MKNISSDENNIYNLPENVLRKMQTPIFYTYVLANILQRTFFSPSDLYRIGSLSYLLLLYLSHSFFVISILPLTLVADLLPITFKRKKVFKIYTISLMLTRMNGLGVRPTYILYNRSRFNLQIL